jgi:hypothetical protein
MRLKHSEDPKFSEDCQLLPCSMIAHHPVVQEVMASGERYGEAEDSEALSTGEG